MSGISSSQPDRLVAHRRRRGGARCGVLPPLLFLAAGAHGELRRADRAAAAARSSGSALADGAPFRLSQLKGKWVLVSVDAGAVRGRLREQARLHAAAAPHPGQGHGARRARLARERCRRAAQRCDRRLSAEPGCSGRPGPVSIESFPAPRAPADHIYLVDPLGNLMLRFPRDPDTRRLIKDLSRLLKASRVG